MFNKNLELMWVLDKEYKSIAILKVNKDEIISKINNFVSSIIHKQSKLLLTCNGYLIYQDKFK